MDSISKIFNDGLNLSEHQTSNNDDKINNTLVLSEDISTLVGSFNSFCCANCRQKKRDGYRYTCLECADYELCDDCFNDQKPAGNKGHKSGHKVLRFNGTSNFLFGVDFRKDELNLENLKKKYENEIHTDFNCNICNDSIKGLRYKCSRCVDFHLCEKCSKESFERTNDSSTNHLNSHSLITYCKSENYSIDYSKVVFDKFLGKGSFGTVHKVSYLGKFYACKKIEINQIKNQKDNLDNLTSIKRELIGYKEIIGDNILKMIGYCEIKETDGEKFIILSEFMEKGSLREVIKEEPYLSYHIRFKIATGIAKGMELIHKIGFIHRDIRPENILISFDYTPKIGDMGIMKPYEEKMKITAGIGCSEYMPPEYYSNKVTTKLVTKKLDVFTFGLTLNELFFGKHIDERKDERTYHIKIEKECEVIYSTLIVNYIDSDPDKRPDSKEISGMLKYIYDAIDRIAKLDSTFKASSEQKQNEKFQQLFNESYTKYKNEKASKIDNIKEKSKKLKEFYTEKLKFHELINNNEEDSMVPAILEKISRLYLIEYDVDNAISYAKKAIQKVIEIVGNENDEQILYYKRYLALVYLKIADRPQEAIEIYQHVLTKLEKPDLEKSNPYISNVYYRIGECYEKLNQIEIALDYHLKCLRLRRAFYDNNSEYIVTSLTKIRVIYLKLNNMDKYFDYRREELRIKKELFKLKHPDKEYFDVMLIRGKDKGRPAWHYISVDDEEKLVDLYKQKAGTNIDVADYGRVLESGWGEEPSDDIKKEIVEMYHYDYPQFKLFKIGNKQVNEYFLQKSEDHILNDLYDYLKLDYEFYNGEYNLEMAVKLFNISTYFFEKLKNLSNSIVFSDKCIEICNTLSSPLARKLTADALMLKGRLNIKDKNYDNALSCFNQSLEIRLESYKKNNPKIAFNYFYIGESYFALEEYDKALEYYVKCEDIYKIAYQNQSNSFVCNIVEKIFKTHQKLNEKASNNRIEEIEIN